MRTERGYYPYTVKGIRGPVMPVTVTFSETWGVTVFGPAWGRPHTLTSRALRELGTALVTRGGSADTPLQVVIEGDDIGLNVGGIADAILHVCRR